MAFNGRFALFSAIQQREADRTRAMRIPISRMRWFTEYNISPQIPTTPSGNAILPTTASVPSLSGNCDGDH